MIHEVGGNPRAIPRRQQAMLEKYLSDVSSATRTASALIGACSSHTKEGIAHILIGMENSTNGANFTEFGERLGPQNESEAMQVLDGYPAKQPLRGDSFSNAYVALALA